MGRLSFFVIIISLSAVGGSNGASLSDYCPDKLSCLNKPQAYDEYQLNIDEMVQKNQDLISNKLFNPPEEPDVNITGDDENCMSITTVEKPFVIKTNVTSEIVVQSIHFEQKIRMTRCWKPQSHCFTKVKIPGFGIRTFCEEKFGGVSLYIYDPEQKKIQYKMFEVPVCCVCKMEVDYGGNDI